jgi:hypothetical protein
MKVFIATSERASLGYPWIGLSPAQDSPFHLCFHSILGTYFHIWKTIDGNMRKVYSIFVDCLIGLLLHYIENNTWVRGNTRFISSVEHDISRVSAANE